MSWPGSRAEALSPYRDKEHYLREYAHPERPRAPLLALADHFRAARRGGLIEPIELLKALVTDLVDYPEQGRHTAYLICSPAPRVPQFVILAGSAAIHPASITDIAQCARAT